MRTASVAPWFTPQNVSDSDQRIAVQLGPIYYNSYGTTVRINRVCEMVRIREYTLYL